MHKKLYKGIIIVFFGILSGCVDNKPSSSNPANLDLDLKSVVKEIKQSENKRYPFALINERTDTI